MGSEEVSEKQPIDHTRREKKKSAKFSQSVTDRRVEIGLTAKKKKKNKTKIKKDKRQKRKGNYFNMSMSWVMFCSLIFDILFFFKYIQHEHLNLTRIKSMIFSTRFLETLPVRNAFLATFASFAFPMILKVFTVLHITEKC